MADKRNGVENDPQRDDEGLADDVLRRPEEPCRLLGGTTERIIAKRPMMIDVGHEVRVGGGADILSP